MNNASQTCQDESSILKVLNMEEKENEKFNSTSISTIVKKKVIFLKEIT